MKSMRLSKLLLWVSCMLFSVAVMAQERTVTGKVTDQTGKSLEGVSVKVKNTSRGTTTNTDGIFSITVPSNESVLNISYVGFLFYEAKVGTGNNLSIQLTPIDKTLDDVVVVGYGTKKRVNVLGSVGILKATEVEDIAVANLSASLINRLPGVSVSTVSGKPGSTTSINVRQASTFSSSFGLNSNPLYIIDGLVSTLQDFNNLDATLVEDISVLKDASAAIYGAAGANGVILVTTRKGRPGKPRISYSGYLGISTPSVKPDVMSAYEHAKMLNDGYELNNSPENNRFTQAELEYLKTNPYQSWYDQMWKNSSVNRHTINVSGGTDRVTFFAGGNYYEEKGSYGGITLRKYGLRTGMNAKIIDGLTANVIMGTDFSRDERHTLKGANDETDDLSLRALMLTPQWVPLYVQGKPVNWAQSPNPPGAWNPMAMEAAGNYKWQRSQNLTLNASLEYKPKFLPGLFARFQYGKNNRNSDHKEYFPPYSVYNIYRPGPNQLLFSDSIITNAGVQSTNRISNSDQLGESTTTYGGYQFNTQLGYSKKLGLVDFDVMVGMEQLESQSKNVFYYRNGQTVAGIDQFWAFSTASSVIRDPIVSENVKRGYFSRMNFAYANKYFVEFIGRYDASAKFSPDSRWGFFPSVGLGWKISDEKFFKDNVSFVSYLKLRANYGLLGNDGIDARLWKERYSQTPGYLLGTAGSAVASNGLNPSVYPIDITWEKVRSLNIGFDATLLNGNINLSADFYQKYMYDGYNDFSASAIPWTSAIISGGVNYGKRLSWGSEFTVGYKSKIRGDWGYSADIVFGFGNSQTLQQFYSTANLDDWGTNYYDIPIGRDPRKYNGSNFGYIAKGIIRTQAEVDAILAKNPNYRIGGTKPQVGFMDFEDIDGDGQINDRDIVPMYDNTSTRVGFGITLGLSYKTFKLSTNINLNIGGKKFYDSEARKVPTTNQNAPSFWNDHWTPDNPDAKYPRADAPLARENSTFWAVNGTQSRINNMVLSYAMPKRISERLRIPDFRILLTGTNLWNIINPFKYKDPYTSNFAYYPTMRTISLGLNVTL